jgi:mycoredoxin
MFWFMPRHSLAAASIFRPFVVVTAFSALVLTVTADSQAAHRPGDPSRIEISSSDTSVTIYGATWCSACKSLEGKLDARKIPYSVIDVDKNRDAYDKARSASGMGSGIPLTHITQHRSTWVQGDDADAVEKAYNGE